MERDTVRNTGKELLAKAMKGFSYLGRPQPRQSGARIVVYHDVNPVDREYFRRHLQYFSKRFKIVSLSHLADSLTCGRCVDDWLSITFDDGLKNNAEIAVPLLREFGFTACFFVSSEFASIGISGESRYKTFVRKNLERKDFPTPMTWEDMTLLLNQGFSIGSHTRSHRNLATLSAKEATEEIFGSRDDFERHLGMRPTHFAWPFGRQCHFREELRQLVCEAGYETCSSAERGRNVPKASVYNLKRDYLEPKWSEDLVSFFLEGRYENMRRFLHLAKRPAITG